MSDPKVATIQAIYEAFGKGDVAAILEALTDDVDWAVGGEPSVAPWYGRRTGKTEVAGFFEALAANLEVTEFTPLSFTSNDTDVMVVIRYSVRVRASGKSGTMDLHHWWRFRDGKIWYIRGTEDTALTAELLS